MFRKLALTAALVTGLAAAPGADAASKCRTPDSKTLAASPHSRAYSVNGGSTVIVCLKKTGQRRTLDAAGRDINTVEVAGGYVAYSTASPDSEALWPIVNVERIVDGASSEFLPFDTGGQVMMIVVKPNGAAAWTVTPPDDSEMSYVQGTDRSNHTPSLLSDSEQGVNAVSLNVLPGANVSWLYADGTTDSASLFTGPAEVF